MIKWLWHKLWGKPKELAYLPGRRLEVDGMMYAVAEITVSTNLAGGRTVTLKAWDEETYLRRMRAGPSYFTGQEE